MACKLMFDIVGECGDQKLLRIFMLEQMVAFVAGNQDLQGGIGNDADADRRLSDDLGKIRRAQRYEFCCSGHLPSHSSTGNRTELVSTLFPRIACLPTRDCSESH